MKAGEKSCRYKCINVQMYKCTNELEIMKKEKKGTKTFMTNKNKADRHKSRACDTTSHYAKKSKVGQTNRPTDQPTDRQ